MWLECAIIKGKEVGQCPPNLPRAPCRQKRHLPSASWVSCEVKVDMGALARQLQLDRVYI
ncbi:hypothetical protein CUR178_04861 [Leishmania enriettii]|uniref:Uncharacterized protein n=1 Tax=Leishmania enriettii TaxID=5663 RepID=A0A836GSG8_LEIEN|nr:hypothetical protein CUR178_04861 [Leishmania enriettii]